MMISKEDLFIANTYVASGTMTPEEVRGKVLGDEYRIIDDSERGSDLSWMHPSGSSLATPFVHYEKSNSADIYECSSCSTRHRIDVKRLGAVEVLECQKCGASLI